MTIAGDYRAKRRTIEINFNYANRASESFVSLNYIQVENIRWLTIIFFDIILERDNRIIVLLFINQTASSFKLSSTNR